MNMEKRWLVLLGAIVMVQVFGIIIISGCLVEEKAALLEFKASYFNESVLPSWVDEAESNCCGWERVTCHATSGHIIHLSLGWVQTVWTCENEPHSIITGFNWSLFQTFTELRTLNLSGNCIYGFLWNRDYGSNSVISWKLETLVLSSNSLNNSIMEPLSALTSLKNLILAYNELAGPFPIKELSLLQNLELLDLGGNKLRSPLKTQDHGSLSALKKLKTLDLSYNFLNNSIMEPLSALTSLKHLILAHNELAGPFSIKELSLLQNLELLDLSENYLRSPLTTPDPNAFSRLRMLKTLNLRRNEFDMGVLNPLVALPALKSLYLSDNDNFKRSKGLNGSLTIQGLCKMKQLQKLDLSNNYVTGTLDTCLGNLTSLKALDLSHNFLSGNIPAPLFARLSSLEYLSLSNNNFEGLFSLSTLANHSKLKVLKLGKMNNNTHEFQVETENLPWIPSFQLEFLEISHCQVNIPAKRIPTFLSYQHGLAYIDISYNNLVGMFPNWLLVNNPKLEAVFLKDNSFTGSFKLPFEVHHRLDQLHDLDISNNQIQGELPNNIGLFVPHLNYFNVSGNLFNGHVPNSIGKMSDLLMLDLAYNNFSGEVPKQILLGCVSLWSMSLSNNNLQGQIFSTPMTNMAGLIFLMMDNNQFNGTLPSWIGKLGLHILSASRNKFEGEIIKELCQLKNLGYLDLSHNRFSGVIPSCFDMSLAKFIHLRGNNLSGRIPETLLNSSSLVTIDLRDNNFTGSIPKSIYKLESLRFLLLAGNQLHGQLSSQICQLTNINILDLSRNNFIGSLPSCINNLSFGERNFDFRLDISNPSISIDPSYDYHYDYFIFSYDEGFLLYGEDTVQFITKGSSLSYKGDILYLMSGLDLSSNQFTGEIPHQIGDLHALHALNLSNNHLNGPIPESFHKIESIESLDLSGNNLCGQIPLQLQDLHFLSVFNVSYNNLSGRAPEKGQFATFDESSYKGNPYLSWNISNRGIATPPSSTPSNDAEENDFAIDFTSFYWTFAASYVAVMSLLVTILWINPYWRRVWFNFVQGCLHRCFGQFLGYAFY